MNQLDLVYVFSPVVSEDGRGISSPSKNINWNEGGPTDPELVQSILRKGSVPGSGGKDRKSNTDIKESVHCTLVPSPTEYHKVYSISWSTIHGVEVTFHLISQLLLFIADPSKPPTIIPCPTFILRHALMKVRSFLYITITAITSYSLSVYHKWCKIH